MNDEIGVADPEEKVDETQPDQNGILPAGIGIAFHNIEVTESEGGESS